MVLICPLHAATVDLGDITCHCCAWLTIGDCDWSKPAASELDAHEAGLMVNQGQDMAQYSNVHGWVLGACRLQMAPWIAAASSVPFPRQV